MGARESRSQQEAGDDDGDTTSQDYYAILEVDENASADEIRVSSSSGFLVRLVVGLHPSDGPLPFLFLFFNCDSVRSDVSHSFITPTRIMMTLKVRPGASLRCSKRMRYVRWHYHIDASGMVGSWRKSRSAPSPSLVPINQLL